MRGEVWREVKGFPNYKVSNFGRVASHRKRLILKPRPERGRLRVTFSEEGHKVERYVHHLVAAAFFPEYRNEQVFPVDGDYNNCRVDNLYIKKRQRSRRTLAQMLATREVHGDVRAWGRKVIVKELGMVFRTVRDAADYIHGDYSAIYKCLREQRGSHLGYTFKYYTDNEKDNGAVHYIRSGQGSHEATRETDSRH